MTDSPPVSDDATPGPSTPRPSTQEERIARFRTLHEVGTFVMPNPWDIGSARILAGLGFPALATTSGGHATSLGRVDGGVRREELIDHVAELAAAVDVPLNVDAERCFAATPEGVAATIREIGEAGASGASIEDWCPDNEAIDPVEESVERLAAAVEAASDTGLLLTARAENHIRGVPDLDDTINRLCAYRDAGADVVYAPGLYLLEDLKRVVDEVGLPVNYLALPAGPSVGDVGEIGVRRISTGSSLARAAYAAMIDGADELLGDGTSNYLARTESANQMPSILAPYGQG